MSETKPPRRTLAERLDHLFRTIHPRGRGEYSYEEVAEAIRARGGPTISATYLWQLRKGVRDNPTKKHLEVLADFFGVSPAYFFDDEAAARIEAELELLVALRDRPVRQLALRAFGLSPESLAAIAEMIERVRQLEGLSEGIDEDESAHADDRE
jgi:transcriptional regulator with XRE-family HTH domain